MPQSAVRLLLIPRIPSLQGGLMRLAAGTRIEAEAILFDMDGTLVNSTSAVECIWQR